MKIKSLIAALCDVRRLTALLFLPVLLFSQFAPIAIPTAHAQNPATNQNPFDIHSGLVESPPYNPPGVAGPFQTNKQRSVYASRLWQNVRSVQDARLFFFLSPDDGKGNLKWRALADDNWQIPTGDPAPGKSAELDKAKKYRVQIFRSSTDEVGGEGLSLPFDQYENPKTYDHRTFTLTGASFLDSSEIKEALDKAGSIDSLGGGGAAVAGAGAGALICSPGVILSVACAGAGAAVGNFIFNGGIKNFIDGDSTENYSIWFFTNSGNSRVQQVLRCTGGGADKNKFLYTGSKPSAGDFDDSDEGFDEDHKIGDLKDVYDPGAKKYEGQEFHNTSLAAFLCDRGKESKSFEQFCNRKLGEQNCLMGVKEIFPEIFNPLGWAVGQLRGIVGAFVDLATDALDAIVNLSVTTPQGLTDVWKVMRDLVNILFILILGAIAFSTMLRIDTQRYGLRSLLPRLIAAIIGVNFSLLIVQVLVNTATVLGQPFSEGIDRIGSMNPAGDVDGFAGAADLGLQVILLIAALVTAIALVCLVLLFVVRIVMIWVLAALAPLAFLFSVLPFSRSLSMQWLKQLLKWVYMAPIAYIILWMGVKFLSASASFGNELIQVAIFIGTVIAAIMIPLRLGGEVMQRAVSGGKAAAGKGLKSTSAGRAAQAFVKRRQEAQDQGAQLRASGWQGALSQRFPGRAGRMLTGGGPAQIGAQQAALENKYAGDIKEMGNKVGVPERKMIAEGRADELRDRNLHAAADLASRPEGRRAAGRLLGQSGHLTQGFLQKLPEKQRQEQIAAGNQGFMKDYDPVLAAKNSQGQITEESLQGIKSHVGAVGPEATKDMYWGDIRKASFEPGKEGEAGQAALGAVSTVNAAENVKVGARHRIAPDGERDAFVRGVLRHGSAKSKQALYNQLKENKSIDSNDDSARKYKKLAEGFGVDTS